MARARKEPEERPVEAGALPEAAQAEADDPVGVEHAPPEAAGEDAGGAGLASPESEEAPPAAEATRAAAKRAVAKKPKAEKTAKKAKAPSTATRAQGEREASGGR